MMTCIQAAQVTAPTQLPQNISPLNHPYNGHTSFRPASPIRNHRHNMVPLTTALTQYAAICSRKHVNQLLRALRQQKRLRSSSGKGGKDTVVPQLACEA
jgi:hypothetical protein